MSERDIVAIMAAIIFSGENDLDKKESCELAMEMYELVSELTHP